MTKIKTDMKRINTGFNKVFQAGYCDLQYIFKYKEPQYYNCGVYGWNCDIYIDYKRDTAITTGYRNMRGELIPSDLIKQYSETAKNIMENMRRESYDIMKAELDKNREKFLDELNKL